MSNVHLLMSNVMAKQFSHCHGKKSIILALATLLAPQEAYIANGVLNREINKSAGKNVGGLGDLDPENPVSQSLCFVYPYGATLHVVKPSIPVLSSGKHYERPLTNAFIHIRIQ